MLYVLEEIFKSKKNQNSDRFNLRIQRALSWLKKAAHSQDDLDIQFLSLWVSFNAIHVEENASEAYSQQIKIFIDRIYSKDHCQKISHYIWGEILQPTQYILNHPYVFQAYWDYQNQKISHLKWKNAFDQDQQSIQHASKAKETKQIVGQLFERMLSLRNQVLQGGSSYGNALNRQQLKASCHILLILLPVFLEVMIENAQYLDLNKPFYPMIQMS